MEFQKCSECDYFSYEKDHVLAHMIDEHTKFKVKKGEYAIIELQTVMKKMFLGQTNTRIIPIEQARKWNNDKKISIHEYETETYETEIEIEDEPEIPIPEIPLGLEKFF